MAQVNLIKVVKDETFVDSKGNERKQTFYALENSNGNIVVVKPCFKDGYAQLDLLADKRFVHKGE